MCAFEAVPSARSFKSACRVGQMFGLVSGDGPVVFTAWPLPKSTLLAIAFASATDIPILRRSSNAAGDTNAGTAAIR